MSANTIININTIDPIKELEFMRHVMQTYDRHPDYDDPVRLNIERAFGVKMGKSIKEFVFKRPEGNGGEILYVFLGEDEDIKKIYQTAHALTDRYWLYGTYPYDEITECSVVGFLSYEALNSDLDYSCRMFLNIINAPSAWEFYWKVARDLYVFKLDHASNNFAQFEQLMRMLGYKDQETMLSTISIKSLSDALYQFLVDENWASAINLFIQAYKYPFKKNEPIDEYEDM